MKSANSKIRIGAINDFMCSSSSSLYEWKKVMTIFSPVCLLLKNVMGLETENIYVLCSLL